MDGRRRRRSRIAALRLCGALLTLWLRHYCATTIVRYFDARGRPLRQLVEVRDEHAVLIKSEQRRLSVRDLRGSP
jgi:hypothetical protein